MIYDFSVAVIIGESQCFVAFLLGYPRRVSPSKHFWDSPRSGSGPSVSVDPDYREPPESQFLIVNSDNVD